MDDIPELDPLQDERILETIKIAKAKNSRKRAILSSLVCLVVAASLLSSPFLREFCSRHPGLIAVLIGVSGEVYFDWREEKGAHAKWKKFFMALLVVGLTYEMYEASESDKEAANALKEAGKANERAGNAEKEAQTFRLEADKLEIEIANNSPLKQPIVSISAVAAFKIKGNISSDGIPPNPSPSGHAGIVFLNGTNFSGTNISLSAELSDMLVTVVIPRSPTNADERQVFITFHEPDVFFRYFFDTLSWHNQVGYFSDVGAFCINFPEMGTNVHILPGGTVSVTANSSHWIFSIPPQKQKWGMITSQIVTNADKQIDAKIFVCPVIDMTGQSVGIFDGL